MEQKQFSNYFEREKDKIAALDISNKVMNDEIEHIKKEKNSKN